MSWYKIGVISKKASNGTSSATGGKKTSTDGARNRLFRISIMSCACLLMNTAATVYVSVVLDAWSASSNLWLTCTVSEEVFTRNWSNYGLHVGDRCAFLCCVFVSGPTTTRRLVLCFFLTALLCSFLLCVACRHSPPGYEVGHPEYQSVEAIDRRRGLLKKVCSKERAMGVIATWSVSMFCKDLFIVDI